MKKKSALLMGVILSLSLVMTGCQGQIANESQAEEEKQEAVQEEAKEEPAKEETGQEENMGNPWSDITEEEAKENCARLFKAPDGAENINWSIMKEGAGQSGFPGPLVQLRFDMPECSEIDFCARARETGDENEDIAGMYYEWTVEDEGTMANWGGGEMPYKAYRYKGEDETADLMTWYDTEIGILYSLSAVAPDLDGFDLQGIAEAMYNPENDDMGGQYSDFLQEQAGKTDFKDYDEIISCLKEGQGYALVDIMGSDEKALLITEMVFEADNSAYEASIYLMSEGKPSQMTLITGNGSAYPLRIDKEGIIYGGDNHTYETYVASNIGSVMCKDYVTDDIETGDGTFTGYLRPSNDYDHDEDFTGGRKEFDKLIENREKQPAIEFTVVSGKESSDIPSKDEHEMTTDIEGCDTLTQIVDKLEDGKGYMNVNIGESGVLLVASGTYEYDKDTYAAIDAEVFDYDDDGKVVYAGYASAGGTAYPLYVKDGKLYVGGNHFMEVMTVKDHKLKTEEAVYIEYDKDGNATYTWMIDGKESGKSSEEAEKRLTELYEDIEKAEVIKFDTVGGSGE